MIRTCARCLLFRKSYNLFWIALSKSFLLCGSNINGVCIFEIVKTCHHLQTIHPCHTAAILSRETKRALFYHAKPRNGNHGDEAKRGKTKLFWSRGAIWPSCDKGEFFKMKIKTQNQTKFADFVTI